MSLQDTGPETVPNDASFDTILSYDWDNDREFQTGLAPILANATSPEHAGELTLQAKCYYFSRQSGIPISFGLFKHYVTSKGQGPSPSAEAGPVPRASKSPFRPSTLHTPDPSNPNTLQISSQDPPPTPSALYPGPPPPTPMSPNAPTYSGPDKAPYPTSFAHIVELITTGQPIPGIREIPNKISEEKPSESVQSKRKKPWETQATVSGAEAGEMAVDVVDETE